MVNVVIEVKENDTPFKLFCPFCGHQLFEPDYPYCEHILFVYVAPSMDYHFFDFISPTFAKEYLRRVKDSDYWQEIQSTITENDELSFLQGKEKRLIPYFEDLMVEEFTGSNTIIFEFTDSYSYYPTTAYYGLSLKAQI